MVNNKFIKKKISNKIFKFFKIKIKLQNIENKVAFFKKINF